MCRMHCELDRSYCYGHRAAKELMSASQTILSYSDTYDAEFVRMAVRGVEMALRGARQLRWPVSDN